MLTAQGVSAVSVRRRPRVTLLSSGRELRTPDQNLAPGQIHDSNLPMLVALRRAALDADLVITTAGISVGDEDHVRDAVRDLGGGLAVLSVAMKPGNPLAAVAGAIAFVRPLLVRMIGTTPPAALRVRAGFDIRRKQRRTEFIPVRLRQHDACLWAERAGPDGSGRLAPFLAATGFAVLSAQDGDVRRGAMLDFMPFMPSAMTA